MDFASSDGLREEQEVSNFPKGKKICHRHTLRQIQQLESFFKQYPHPDENQRRQLSRELGLKPKQIKFWFQNKRTQIKAQNERSDNSGLRAENERIHCENLAIREALKNVICPTCGGPPFGEEERQRSLLKLQFENTQLKEEHDKVSNLLAKYIGKPISQIDSLMPVHKSPSDHMLPTSLSNQGMQSLIHDFELNEGISDSIPLAYQFKGISDMEKAIMLETASTAMEELVRLVQVDEPLWTKSSSSDRRYVIHRQNYEKMFPSACYFKGSNGRVESSKDSGIVTINSMDLVEMFLDPNKWVDLFPTIVNKVRTLQAIEIEGAGDQNGSLQLMYAQMHILSPLVPPREFYFLRQCQQIDQGMWVIVDVSYDCLKESFSPSRSWRLPSGCMIQDLLNGCSKVTWVEHVKVDDKTQTHRLYRDLVSSGSAYGAKRWIVTLQRMCERLAFTVGENASIRQLGGVISSMEGRTNLMKLSYRMVKNFSAVLSMSGKLDFPQLCEVHNSGVRVSVRKSVEAGQPYGIVVSVATSLWLPLPQQDIFDFLKSEKTRTQWDVLSNGNLMHEIAHISTGVNSGNYISIIRPFVPAENNMLILQESCTDAMGSMVVYAPIDIPTMNMAISGSEDFSSTVPILPSGFVISNDGRSESGYGGGVSPAGAIVGRSGGSLLTIAFQILVSSYSSSFKELNMEAVATVNTLISSTVQKIKVALNCSNLD